MVPWADALEIIQTHPNTEPLSLTRRTSKGVDKLSHQAIVTIDTKNGDNKMFGSLFKKRKPTLWLQQQPGTRVLLLPDKFKDNEVTRQVFTLQERFKLIKIFEEKGAEYKNYGFSDDEPIFVAHILNMGEKFYSDENDLTSEGGDVREFEVFAKRY